MPWGHKRKTDTAEGRNPGRLALLGDPDEIISPMCVHPDCYGRVRVPPGTGYSRIWECDDCRRPWHRLVS